MSVAAIIVTHNSSGDVGACVRSLLEAELDVVVVDNASSDGTVAAIAGGFPQVRLVGNRENRGFAVAVNQALALVDAEVVLLLNPDCVVPPETVRALAAHLAAHPEVGAVGPRVLSPSGRMAISAHPFESPLAVIASRFGGSIVPVSLRRLLSGCRRRAAYDACRGGTRPLAVDWLSGACLALREPLLRRLGGLDTGYFMYYEDEELCLQIWRAGSRVEYLPAVAVVHAGGASSGDPAAVWPHLYRSLLRFQASHHPRAFALVRAAIFVRALLGIATGAGRDTVASLRGKPARRALAWVRVARLTLFEEPATTSVEAL